MQNVSGFVLHVIFDLGLDKGSGRCHLDAPNLAATYADLAALRSFAAIKGWTVRLAQPISNQRKRGPMRVDP